MKKAHIKCPYCGSQAYLRPASVLGKTDECYNGKEFYVCARYPACDAYVAAHSTSRLPMGTLADKRLRWLRRDAHVAMERLWNMGIMTKQETYRWLQTQMGIPPEDAHIAKFSEFRCEAVIRMCSRLAASQKAA